MLKRILFTATAILLGSVSLAYGATAFYSNQEGSSATNGYVLQTNGTNSTWVATSSLGITGGGGSSANAIATSAAETAGQIAYWTSTNVTPATLGKIATSSLSASSPLTGSFVQIGSGGSLGIQAASNSQNGYLTAADFSLIHAATTTFSSPLVYTLSTNAVTCPTCYTGTPVTSVSGTWPILSSGGTTPTISWGGIATATPFSNNQFVYTNGSGNLVTAASSSLNLPNAALANSSITVNGTTFNLGDSKTITAASSTLLANNNTFSGNNLFSASTTINAHLNLQDATSTTFGTGVFYNSGITSALASFDATHKETAYAGTNPCSANQAIVSLSALGVGSCSSTFQLSGTYLTALGNYATTTGTAISISTSTTLVNGLTYGNTFAVSANGILVTPTVSGTYTGQAGSLANSLSNDGATLSGSSFNGSAGVSNWAINLGHANAWTAQQSINNTGLKLTATTSSLLATDSTGLVVATTSVGVNYLKGGSNYALLTTDSSGNGIASTSISDSLFANSGVTAAAYTCANVTFDAKGIATAAANGSCGGGGGSWPFSPGTDNGQSSQATSTLLALKGSPFALAASGTIDTSGTTGGYDIDENLILQASSTNGGLNVGQNAGAALLSTSLNNVAIGLSALQNATTTNYSVAIGWQAMKGGAAEDALSNGDVAIGAQSLMSLTTAGGVAANAITAVGSSTLRLCTTCSVDTVMGAFAGAAITTAANNTLVGVNAGKAIVNSANNSFFGVNAGASDTAASNSALGVNALQINTSGVGNNAFGSSALSKVTTHSNNSAFGLSSLASTTGDNNVGYGTNSGINLLNITSASSTFLGAFAGYGSLAGYGETGTVAIGAGSGYNLASSSNWNTCVGTQSCYNLTSGADNIIIGSASSSANGNLTTGSDNIMIGDNINFPSATANGQLDIANLIYGSNIGTSGATLSPGQLMVGTTTPAWGLLALSSGTNPQLSFSDGIAGDINWSWRTISNTLYLATSTVSATSTTAALQISNNGIPSLSVGSTTPTVSAVNGLLTLGSNGTSGSSTISVGKIQLDGYSNTGSRVCVYVVGTTLTVSSGACTP